MQVGMMTLSYQAVGRNGDLFVFERKKVGMEEGYRMSEGKTKAGRRKGGDRSEKFS